MSDNYEDEAIDNLLFLDGDRLVLDDVLGVWVKFDVSRVAKTTGRPFGVKYSLSSHDCHNKRIMGFDNAHPFKCRNSKSYFMQFDHIHQSFSQALVPYLFESAEKLLTDFWVEVDRAMACFNQLSEVIYE